MKTGHNQVHDKHSVGALEYVANRTEKLEIPEAPKIPEPPTTEEEMESPSKVQV